MSKIIVNGKEYCGGGGSGGVSNFTETVLATASSFSDMTVDFSTAYDAFVFYANDTVFQKSESYFFTRSEITDAINNNLGISFYPYGSAGICQYSITRSGLTKAKNSAGYFIYKIVGLNFGSTPHIYNTNEQVIGTWIDGKPLYERTFVLTSGITIDGYTDIALDTTTNKIKNLDGYIERSNGAVDKINGYIQSDDTVRMAIRAGKIEVYISSDFTSVSELWVTIQYTKTTDT